MERRLDAILKRQAKLERQVRAQARESPASDATSALERLAETMGKFNPQAVVPNNPGPYEGGQEFLRWKKYVVRCARANDWTVQDLTARMAQFLDGPAWATFERLRGTDSIPDSVEGLLDAIGAVHCDVRGALRDAKLRFRTRKQKPNESVHHFLTVFEALAIESQATEASKVQTFTDNVCPEIGEALMRKGVETWAETRAAAVLEQRIKDARKDKTVRVAHLRTDDDGDDEAYETALAAVNAIQTRQAWRQQGYTTGGQRSQDTRRPQEPERHDRLEQQLHVLTQMVGSLADRLSATAQQQATADLRGAPRRCYACNEPGHFARECPHQGNGMGARDPAPARAPQP